MRVTPRRCVPLANACQTIYTGSKRTSGHNHHVRTPSPVWRKRYIYLNLWGPCLKWSLKVEVRNMTLSDSRANVYVGRFRNTLGYRHTEYTQSMDTFSSRSPHKRFSTQTLCYQLQIYCNWMLFTPSQCSIYFWVHLIERLVSFQSMILVPLISFIKLF